MAANTTTLKIDVDTSDIERAIALLELKKQLEGKSIAEKIADMAERLDDELERRRADG